MFLPFLVNIIIVADVITVMALPPETVSVISMEASRREKSWNCFDKQRKEGLFCDVTFKCDGGEVLAHKNVLASVSNYFTTLFTSPISRASSTNVVMFEQFSAEAMTVLLDIIYSQAHVSAVYVAELLRLCDYVQRNWLVMTRYEVCATLTRIIGFRGG